MSKRFHIQGNVAGTGSEDHELPDKHVAVGYRDLLNAAIEFMETGST